METLAVNFNNVIDINIYSKKKLINHKRFRIVYNDDNEDAGKRILWENMLPWNGKIDCVFNEKKKDSLWKKMKVFIFVVRLYCETFC